MHSSHCLHCAIAAWPLNCLPSRPHTPDRVTATTAVAWRQVANTPASPRPAHRSVRSPSLRAKECPSSSA
jgi:hypothetical protein